MTISKKLLYCFFALSILFTSCRKQSGDIPGSVQGEVIATSLAVANVLQSYMVVQRDKPVQIWGSATPGAKINVSVSWDGGSYSSVADNNSFWKVTIPAAAANSNAQMITCSTKGRDDVIFTNILIGDVWLCAGQSNMNMPMDAISPFTGVLNYQTEIAAANYPNIRVLSVNETGSNGPASNLVNLTTWTTCSPQTAGKYSAVAYYFANKLHTTLNVPIGLVVAAVNGSYCAQWMNDYSFSTRQELAAYSKIQNGSQYYNGMVSPFTNLSIKGFIWYQGENDQMISPVSDYTKLNSALIEGWRNAFNQSMLPFYQVQLTPFAVDYNDTSPVGGDQRANWLGYFREAQSKVLTTPNTGMAITMDVGEADNHHPRNKKPVGYRLALLALKNTYNQNVICDGPKMSSCTYNGNRAVVNFYGSTADGLTTADNQPLKQEFYVAGSDKIYRKATAAIAGNTIVLTASTDTPLPLQGVRYAFTNVAITNLQNGAGLPAEPFRTDTWDYYN